MFNSSYQGHKKIDFKKMGNKPCETITRSLIELHWLQMKATVVHKICLVSYNALRAGEPKYLHKHFVPLELNTGVTLRHFSDIHTLYLVHKIK